MTVSSKISALALIIIGITVSGTYVFLAKGGKRKQVARTVQPPTRVLPQSPSVKLIDGRPLAEVARQFEVEKQVAMSGVTYAVIDGAAYEIGHEGTLTFRSQYYDAARLAASYVTENGNTWRVYPAQPEIRVLMTKRFKDGFEGANTLGDLIVTDEEAEKLARNRGDRITPEDVPHGWQIASLNSPAAPEAVNNSPDRLARMIVRDEADFIENRVEPSSKIVHTGKRSLHTYALPPPSEMVTTKASLHTELLHFVKGDHVWFSGWYYLAEGLPFTVMDLESSWLLKNSGIRIAIDTLGRLYVELKALDKPKWRQTVMPPTVVPRQQWVNIKLHLLLDDESGIIEVWQDGRIILEGRGPTLPLPKTIYNQLEVGISATHHNNTPTVLYVDDVEISDEPL